VKFALRILGVAVALALVFAVTFAIWGEAFGVIFSQAECVAWFRSIRPVAWLVAMGLLASDLVLPVPATGVMAALGSVYGVCVGAAVGAAGSALSALIGYGLARFAGERAIGRIASPEEIERFRRFFNRWGGGGVIVSRLLPILPEVMSVLAGLAPMKFGRFLVAVLLGTIPTAVLFAWIGHASAERPWYGIVLAVVVPLLLWPVFVWFVGGKGRSADGAGA